jgi:hypothetical protein
MYQVSVTPYYDSIYQCYRQILEIYPKPSGSLANIIKQVQYYPPSPFRKFSDCEPRRSCIYAIMNPTNPCDFLRVDEITLLMCFLTENHFKIDNQITKTIMRANTEIKESLLFYIIET